MSANKKFVGMALMEIQDHAAVDWLLYRKLMGPQEARLKHYRIMRETKKRLLKEKIYNSNPRKNP